MSMVSAGARGTTINRVRLRGAAGLDPISARLRAGRLIEQAADGVALPPAAILCVRRLGDPRPGRIDLTAWQTPAVEWARAVGDTLADLVRRASRPARGPVPRDTEAVIFDDHAQMLASLAADWCRGSIDTWWWRALFGGSRDADVVLSAWRREPAHVAAAIEEIARTGWAVTFVRRMPGLETAALLDAIVEAHGLSPELKSSGRVAATVALSKVGATSTASRPTRIEKQSASAPSVPWQRVAPEACVGGLRVDQELLLGVALTLRRDPARVRDRTFVEEVARWRDEADARAAASSVGVTIGAPPALPAPVVVFDVKDAAGAVEARPVDAAAELPSRAASPPIERPSVVSDQRSETGVPRSADAVPVEAAALLRESVESTMVETKLGGIFYLLNVSLALELYGDFSAPLAPQLDLSIWRFVALVAAALLRGKARRDPVWRLLADLAGPNPASIRGTEEWRLEPSWLAAFPEKRTWRWDADADRVRVRHPDGFFILDLARAKQQSPEDQVRDETNRYRVAASFRLARARNTCTSGVETGADAAFTRWMRWHTLYVRARLARALGVPRARVADLLCRHRARVTLSLTHVDVAFFLADLPIPIRLSGLDRDPGWIPAADRIVSFRYD
jgi:hypothetical protein